MDGKLQLILLLGGGAWWVVRGLARKRMAEQRRQNALVDGETPADRSEPLLPEEVLLADEPFLLEAEKASTRQAADVTFVAEKGSDRQEAAPIRHPDRVALDERPPASPPDPTAAAGQPTRGSTPRLTGRALRDAVIMSEVLRRPGTRR